MIYSSFTIGMFSCFAFLFLELVESISLFMKNHVGAICLICILAFLGNGCKDEETAVTPFLEIAVDTVYFTTSEGSQTIEVSSNTDWNAKAEADWVDVTSNGETMNIHVSENTDPAAREAWVNVSAGEMLETVLVRQLGTESDEIADSHRTLLILKLDKDITLICIYLCIYSIFEVVHTLLLHSVNRSSPVIRE